MLVHLLLEGLLDASRGAFSNAGFYFSLHSVLGLLPDQVFLLSQATNYQRLTSGDWTPNEKLWLLLQEDLRTVVRKVCG